MAGQHAGDDEDDAEDAARAFGWGTAALHIAFASVVSRKEFCRATERAYNNLMRRAVGCRRHPGHKPGPAKKNHGATCL